MAIILNASPYTIHIVFSKASQKEESKEAACEWQPVIMIKVPHVERTRNDFPQCPYSRFYNIVDIYYALWTGKFVVKLILMKILGWSLINWERRHSNKKQYTAGFNIDSTFVSSQIFSQFYRWQEHPLAIFEENKRIFSKEYSKLVSRAFTLSDFLSNLVQSKATI